MATYTGNDKRLQKLFELTASEIGHTYSTTEQVVGKWIDGSDIYETTFEIQNGLYIPYGSWIDTQIQITDFLKSVSCFCIDTDGINWDLSAKYEYDTIRLINNCYQDITINVFCIRYIKSV